MSAKTFPIYRYAHVFVLLAFAAASSSLLAPPGIKTGAFLVSMIILQFGPFTEHLIETTSSARWAIDSALAGILLVMILLRLIKKSRWLDGLAFAGVLLWYWSSFSTMVEHGE